MSAPVIGVFVFAEDASAWYRLLEPVRIMREHDIDITLFTPGDDFTDSPEYFDVVVCNRPVVKEQADFVELLASLGGRIVVDVDDSYTHLAPNHGAYKHLEPVHVERACKAAHLVTATTPALAELYGYGHGSVWPNYIPQRYLDVKPDPNITHSKLWVGWSGSLAAHPNDLLVANGRIGRALKEIDAELSFIGPKDQAADVKAQLKHKGVVQMGGMYALPNYPKALAHNDIGIVPLENTIFNSCKSALKGLEMASVGLPYVASPTADYTRVHLDGLGILAKHPNDWYRALVKLGKDKAYREDMGYSNKEIIRENFVMEDHAEQLLGMWLGV